MLLSLCIECREQAAGPLQTTTNSIPNGGTKKEMNISGGQSSAYFKSYGRRRAGGQFLEMLSSP